jgi:hypothetical protein
MVAGRKGAGLSGSKAGMPGPASADRNAPVKRPRGGRQPAKPEPAPADAEVAKAAPLRWRALKAVAIKTLNVVAGVFRVLWRLRVQIVASVAIGALVQMPQVRDSFLEPAYPIGSMPEWFWLAFLLLACFAIPMHATAQTALDRLHDRHARRGYEWLEFGWEDVLAILAGIAIPLAFAWSIAAAHQDLAQRPDLENEVLALAHLKAALWPFVVCLVFYALYIVIVWVKRDHIAGVKQLRDVAIRYNLNRLILPFAIGLGVAALVAALFPFFSSDLLPRHFILPVLLGGTVFALCCLALLSDGWRVPLIGLGLVAIGAANLFSPPDYMFRMTPLATSSGGFQQTPFEEAVRQWKTANGCSEASTPCPRPVLIAMEGGASRAALFAMTSLGKLLDESAGTSAPNGGAVPTGIPAFASRVFAISGVSGGAVAATAFKAGLARSNDGELPCADETGASAKSTWTACLQALVSGDYLTPTLIGLVFRDSLAGFWRWSGRLHDDRAIILATALEKHFAEATGGSWGRCDAAVTEGLCGLFGDRTALPKAWLPVLILPATNVDTGAPVYFSEIANPPAVPPFLDPLFAEEHDARLAIDWPEGQSITLSTAAVISARFPVISPPAAYPSGDDGHGLPLGRLVDGGYFDNSGTPVLRNIARNLIKLKLRPVILYLKNEAAVKPEQEGGQVDKSGGGGAAANPPAAPKCYERQMAGEEASAGGALQRPGLAAAGALFEAPLTTLVATRNAHAAVAIGTISRNVDEAPSCLHFSRLEPQIDEVTIAGPNGDKTNCIRPNPVSWWLSPAGIERFGVQVWQRSSQGSAAEFLRIVNETIPVSDPASECAPQPGPSDAGAVVVGEFEIEGFQSQETMQNMSLDVPDAIALAAKRAMPEPASEPVLAPDTPPVPEPLAVPSAGPPSEPMLTSPSPELSPLEEGMKTLGAGRPILDR